METWLNRIKGNYPISKPLLDKGYLSVGFSDFIFDFDKEGFLKFIDPAYEGENRGTILYNIAVRLWGEGSHRTINNLYRFLVDYREGDRVIVPSWGTFSVYTLVGRPLQVAELPQEVVDSLIPLGQKEPVTLREDGYLVPHGATEEIDIGFLWKVSPLHPDPGKRDIPRDLADAALAARLKIRLAIARITDFSTDIDKAIKHFDDGTVPSLHASAEQELKGRLLDVIMSDINPDKFERLVMWYLTRMGAENAQIPSKHQDKNDPEADVDVIATFEALKVRINVQCKRHVGSTDEKGVRQIIAYARELEERELGNDDIYNDSFWVVSTAEFSVDAKNLAFGASVRLVNGMEFARMLLDAGIAGIDGAFA
jgi:hypothetical protein